MSNPWDKPFDISDIPSSYRGDLDPEKMVWLQIQRCNILHSQGDEELYGNSVMSLLINIPTDIQIELENADYQELYYKKEKIWKPVRGRSSDPNNPFIINNPNDIDYDPNFNGGKPLQVSPIEIDEEKWDYYTLQKLIMRMLQERGLTWKKQRTEIFTGEEWDPAFNPPEEEEDDEPKEPPKD